MLIQTVTKQIVISFLLMLIGIGCYKRGILNESVNKPLSNFVLNIVSPAVILNACQISYSPALLHNLLLSFILSGLSYGVTIGCSYLFIRKKAPNFNIERFSAVYSNCGFIGVPLIHSIYGNEGILYLTCYLAMFNILLWTHGVFCISGKIDRKQVAGILKCPAIIAVVLGLTCFMLHVTLPSVIGDTVSLVADLNTPLAMIVAGISVVQSNMLQALRKKRIYYITFLKLILIPLAFLFLISPLHIEEKIVVTVVLATGCPTGVTGIMFALRYNSDEGYAAEIFAVTTALSVITLPVLVFLCTLV